MTWTQIYLPVGNIFLSAFVAALPVVVLLGLLVFGNLLKMPSSLYNGPRRGA